MYGYLKFYDEEKKFGFIRTSEDVNDIFFHYDDIIFPAGITCY
jgi:cold shock CspA family protein